MIQQITIIMTDNELDTLAAVGKVEVKAKGNPHIVVTVVDDSPDVQSLHQLPKGAMDQ